MGVIRDRLMGPLPPRANWDMTWLRHTPLPGGGLTESTSNTVDGERSGSSTSELWHNPQVLAQIEAMSGDEYAREQEVAIGTLLHGNPRELSDVQRLIAVGYIETLAIKLGMQLVVKEDGDG